MPAEPQGCKVGQMYGLASAHHAHRVSAGHRSMLPQALQQPHTSVPTGIQDSALDVTQTQDVLRSNLQQADAVEPAQDAGPLRAAPLSAVVE